MQVQLASTENISVACCLSTKKVEEDGEQFEVGVGVGGWALVDSLAILAPRLNTDYRASPVVDKAILDPDDTEFLPIDFDLEQARFHFPYLQRTASNTAFSFVVNAHCPDSTFIFPIAADALLVIKNYLHDSTLDNIS